MKIEDYIKKLIDNYNKSMPAEDWKLLNKIGNGYHDLTYEEYRKNPEKWNKFNDEYHKFIKWTWDKSSLFGNRRLIKFSDKHYLDFYWILSNSNKKFNLEVNKVITTNAGESIHQFIYPWCNRIDGGSNFQWLKDEFEKESGDMIPLWNNTSNEVSLKEKYLLESKKIKSFDICIVGQDRYKTGSNGIAFCKNTFQELYNEYCCGKDVLNSLGIKEEEAISNNETPVELFIKLLAEGTAFINICHDLIANYSEDDYKKDKSYNVNFLNKAKKIVVLGTTDTVPLFEKYYPEFVYKGLIHPSNRAKESSPTKWSEIWSSQYLYEIKNTANMH